MENYVVLDHYVSPDIIAENFYIPSVVLIGHYDENVKYPFVYIDAPNDTLFDVIGKGPCLIITEDELSITTAIMFIELLEKTYKIASTMDELLLCGIHPKNTPRNKKVYKGKNIFDIFAALGFIDKHNDKMLPTSKCIEMIYESRPEDHTLCIINNNYDRMDADQINGIMIEYLKLVNIEIFEMIY